MGLKGGKRDSSEDEAMLKRDFARLLKRDYLSEIQMRFKVFERYLSEILAWCPEIA